MSKNQELIKLWSNQEKRRAFVNNYKEWGIWFVQPELGLTYYKYDLLDDSMLIAMEYQRKPHRYEKSHAADDNITCYKLYHKTGAYFDPTAVSEYVLAEHLKQLKDKLTKEIKI